MSCPSRRLCLSILVIIWSAVAFVGEIAVGLRTHSLCPIVLGLHTLYTLLEEIIQVASTKIPNGRSDKNTFGWARSKDLGVTINSVFMAALNFSMVISALKRLAEVEHLHDPLIVVIAGAIAATADTLMLLVFYCIRCGPIPPPNTAAHIAQNTERAESESLVVDFLETGKMRNSGCDARRSLTNFLAALVMTITGLVRIYHQKEAWSLYIDTVMSLIMVAIIIWGTYPKLHNACMVLLQASPLNIDVDDLQAKISEQIPCIFDIHEFHLWQLTPDHVIATLHVTCRQAANIQHIYDRIAAILRKHGVKVSTIQPEYLQGGEEIDGLTTTDKSAPLCTLDCGLVCNKYKCCSG